MKPENYRLKSRGKLLHNVRITPNSFGNLSITNVSYTSILVFKTGCSCDRCPLGSAVQPVNQMRSSSTAMEEGVHHTYSESRTSFTGERPQTHLDYTSAVAHAGKARRQNVHLSCTSAATVRFTLCRPVCV